MYGASSRLARSAIGGLSPNAIQVSSRPVAGQHAAAAVADVASPKSKPSTHGPDRGGSSSTKHARKSSGEQIISRVGESG